MQRPHSILLTVLISGLTVAPRAAGTVSGLQTSDLPTLQSVGEVQLAPDASRVVYGIVRNDHPGRPYTTLWIMDLASRRSRPLLPAAVHGGSPRWSPDGRWIAFEGSSE